MHGSVYKVRAMGRRNDEKMIVIPGTNVGDVFFYHCDSDGIRTYTPAVPINKNKPRYTNETVEPITPTRKEEPTHAPSTPLFGGILNPPKVPVESYYEGEGEDGT